jgi:hypothetical protein
MANSKTFRTHSDAPLRPTSREQKRLLFAAMRRTVTTGVCSLGGSSQVMPNDAKMSLGQGVTKPIPRGWQHIPCGKPLYREDIRIYETEGSRGAITPETSQPCLSKSCCMSCQNPTYTYCVCSVSAEQHLADNQAYTVVPRRVCRSPGAGVMAGYSVSHLQSWPLHTPSCAASKRHVLPAHE